MYTERSSYETDGFKLTIEVQSKKQLSKTAKDLLDPYDLGRQLVLLQWQESPEYQKLCIERAEGIQACFPEPIYVEPIPSEYRPYGTPWFIITTRLGHFKVGWRSKVIVLDWEKTDVGETAEELFPEEDVTKDGQMIHAWGYAKLKEYVEKIHASDSESS